MDTEFELESQKGKNKESTRLFWNKFNVSDFSTRFFPYLSRAYNMVRVIDGKILEKWVAKGSKNYFELAEGSSYRGWNYSECKKEFQGKSTLVRVSARFELSGVYCIHKSHNIQHFLSERLENFWCHVEVNENMWHGSTEFGCEATLNL